MKEVRVQEAAGEEKRPEVSFETEQKGRTRKRRKKRRCLLLIAGGLLLLVILIRILGGKGGTGGAEVVSAALTKGNIEERLSISGPVSGTDTADVMSSLHAKVLEISVKEGDRVGAGEVLARLDPHDAAQALSLAEDQLALARANREEAVRTVRIEYAKAQQAEKAARADYTRKLPLYRSGDIARAEFEAVERGLREAELLLQGFRTESGEPVVGESYEIQIRTAEKELEKAQDRMKDTTVTAPIEGIVTRVNTRVGQFADTLADNRPMFTIENLDTLELEIRVSEFSVGKLRVGQKASIHADIMGEKQAEGELVSISPSGELKGNGSSERVIPARIRVKSGDSGLISGITARADILLSEARDVFIVPISALLPGEDGGSRLAFVRDGEVHLSPVKTGVESDLYVEVSPLSEADPYFTEGAHYISVPTAELSDGSRVKESFLEETAEAMSAAQTAEREEKTEAEGGGEEKTADAGGGSGEKGEEAGQNNAEAAAGAGK